MYGNMNQPRLSLDEKLIKWKTSKKYLGVLLNNDISDDTDIENLVTVSLMLSYGYSEPIVTVCICLIYGVHLISPLKLE